MTSNSTVTLRAALELLAEQAPSVDELDHTAWSGRTSGRASRIAGRCPHRPRHRLQLAAIASAVAVVAALVVGTQLIHHRHGTTPASSGRAVLEVRPLVAPGVFVLAAGARASNPLQALPFPIPTTAAEYERLSAAQQQQVRSALATTDCTHQSGSAAPTRVACSAPIDGRRMAFLLGPSLFGNDQIKSAEAVAPSPGLGETEWTVAYILREPAAIAFARYTTAHHTSDFVAHAGPSCGLGAPPCDDVLGFVVNGSVMSTPVTIGPINGGTIQMSGNFDKQSATALAKQLSP
jgi:hypothetical protein